MNNTLKNVLIFVAGATIGSVVTWKLTRDKYEQLIQEEIDSVKEVFSRREQKFYDEKCDQCEDYDDEYAPEITEDDRDEYEQILAERGYVYYSTSSKTEKNEKKESMLQKPYVISPDDFDTMVRESEYDVIGLEFYTDGVVATDDGDVVEDVDNTIGCESLNHFGDYEDYPDTVYVRNDRLKSVYEICKDYGSYSDVIARKPYLAED